MLADSVPPPLFNHIKFRQLALLVLFMMQDDEYRVGYLKADDGVEQRAIAHLNSLVLRSAESSSSTIENDKVLLGSMMYEHFWNHVRLLGFRTELAIAQRLLERHDERTIEAIFRYFLIISNDPEMKWTKETTFVLESLFNGIGNPTDAVFHRQPITKR